MDDFSYAKFFVLKDSYNEVRNILDELSSSSEVRGGLEYFLFEDKSSVSIPEFRRHKINIVTFRYAGRTYPGYYSTHLSQHLKKMHVFKMRYH